MTSPSIEFHKIWIDQCAATESILARFGLENALDYLIGEKLFNFVWASERDSQFAAELPAFVAEILKLFTLEVIRDYLDYLERTKFFAPQDPELVIDDDNDDANVELLLYDPMLGAEELLRFCRIRQLLQE